MTEPLRSHSVPLSRALSSSFELFRGIYGFPAFIFCALRGDNNLSVMVPRMVRYQVQARVNIGDAMPSFALLLLEGSFCFRISGFADDKFVCQTVINRRGMLVTVKQAPNWIVPETFNTPNVATDE